MKEMKLGTGILIFLGFILLLGSCVLKFKGFNILEDVVSKPSGYFTLANTAFILAFVLHIFDRTEED